jgi:hypothetical protein
MLRVLCVLRGCRCHQVVVDLSMTHLTVNYPPRRRNQRNLSGGLMDGTHREGPRGNLPFRLTLPGVRRRARKASRTNLEPDNPGIWVQSGRHVQVSHRDGLSMNSTTSPQCLGNER